MATLASLNLVLGVNSAEFTKGIDKADKAVRQLPSGTASASAGFASMLGAGVAAGAGIGIALAGVSAALGGIKSLASVAFDGLKQGIGGAAELEQNQTSLEVMLGSAEKAKSLLSDLSQFAAETPFATPELVSATKKLVAFGISSGQVLPNLTKLGDIASGLNIPLGELAELYGKAKVAGTLYAEDINQLVGRGIPVIQEFAKQLGVSEDQVKKLGSEGKITFSMLQKAIKSMTDEGGQFSGLMAKQSQTLSGLWGAFKDSIDMKLTGIGTYIIEKFRFKDLITAGSNAIDQLSSYFKPFFEVGLAYAEGVVKEIIKSFGQLGVTSQSVGESLKWAFTTAIRLAGHLADAFTSVQKVQMTVASNVIDAWLAVHGVMTNVVLGLEAVSNELSNKTNGKIPAITGLTGMMVSANNAAVAVKKVIGNIKELDSIDFSAKVDQYLADVEKARAAAANAPATAEQTRATFKIEQSKGFGGAKKWWEQAQKDGPKLWGELEKAFTKEVDKRVGAYQKLIDEGKRVFEATRTNDEKFAMEQKRLQRLLKEGVINDDTFARAIKQAREQLFKEKTPDREDIKGNPAAIERRFGFTLPKASEIATKQDIEKQQLAVQKQMKDLLNKWLGELGHKETIVNF